MDNELMHYGVKGMKWGVIRGKLTGRSATQVRKDDVIKRARKKDMKNRRRLSDADIQKRINRLKMEKELKSLTKEDIAPGRKATAEILSSAGKKMLTAAAAGAMAYGVKAAMERRFNIKEAAQYIAANPNKKK